MKTDRDDAPYYLREKRKARGKGKALAAGLIGACVTAAALYLLGHQGSSIITQVEHVQEAPLAPPHDSPAAPSRAENVQPDTGRQNREQTATARQIDFNDGNYIPRQPVNVVSMEAWQSATHQAAGSTINRRQRHIQHDAAWVEKWSGGQHYLAEWTAIDNRIDGSSVCANHRRGSIDYRECRKAAKQHFKDECRLWEKRWGTKNTALKQRYCSAANSFSPMG